MKAAEDKKTVRFEPDNIDVLADEGANLLQVATDAGVYIAASCGGTGTCGTCKVLIRKGKVESNGAGSLTEDELRQGYRQACKSKILTDLTVFIPVESRLDRTAFTRDDELPEVTTTPWPTPTRLISCHLISCRTSFNNTGGGTTAFTPAGEQVLPEAPPSHP
jgi:ferredoxin